MTGNTDHRRATAVYDLAKLLTTMTRPVRSLYNVTANERRTVALISCFQEQEYNVLASVAFTAQRAKTAV